MSKLNIYACSGFGGNEPTMARRVARDIEDSGWERNQTLRKYLGTSKNGGCAEYFLYIFIPDNELSRYNATIYRKRKQQLKTFEYVRELFVSHNYGTEQDMLDIIRNGIETTFGMSIERVLAGVRGEKGSGSIGGEPISTAVAMIIIAVINVVLAVISGVIAYCQNVAIAKYTAPTIQELEDSAPASTDILTNSKTKGWFLAALLAGGAYLITKYKD